MPLAPLDHDRLLARIVIRSGLAPEKDVLTVLEDLERMHEVGQLRRLFPCLVERAALSLYERVLAGREGLALVPLVNKSCGGCHMVQPPQVISEARLNAKLVTCDSCNRILYQDHAQDHA